jgi:hypothetical protein
MNSTPGQLSFFPKTAEKNEAESDLNALAARTQRPKVRGAVSALINLQVVSSNAVLL